VLSLHEVALDDPRALAVLAALGAEYARRYGSDEELATTTSDEFDPPDGLFVVVVDAAGDVIAGGGFRRFADDTCEIKRMWTAPTSRRRGLASYVLAGLEDAARAVGYQRVILETGPEQPEAHGLYLARAYETAGNLGRYADATAYAKSLV
jgi:GNAT superfamily N-acetyltransferase